MTLADAPALIRAFLSGRSPRTLDAYRQDLHDFRSWLAVPSLEAAAHQLLAHGPGRANALVLAYRTALSDRGLSPSTVNRRLAALRSLVKLARVLGLVTWAIEIESLRVVAYRDTRGPGVTGFAALLTELHGRTDARAIRDRAILWLLFGRGLRRGEIASLDLAHVDLAGEAVSVLGKGRLQREALTIPAQAVTALERWIAVRGELPGPLFVALDRSGRRGRLTGRSIDRMVTRLGDGAGIRARPHGLRHAAITAALDHNGGDVRAAQRFARHASPATTILYDDNRRDIGGEMARLVADAVEDIA